MVELLLPKQIAWVRFPSPAPDERITRVSQGEINFGIKLSASRHPADAGWRRIDAAVLALSSLRISDAWAAHVNLGEANERVSTATLLGLSLVWTPPGSSLLFAETQTNSRREVFGATVNSVGARWWLVNDSLGIDMSASREAGGASPTQWSLGFGW